MTEYAIFFSTDAQLRNILSKLVVGGTVYITRVRRPYLDKTRFGKRIFGTHIISFTVTDDAEKASLPFMDAELVEVNNKKWNVERRLPTMKKRWWFNKVAEKWMLGDTQADTLYDVIEALEIKHAPEFEKTTEISAVEFFGGVNALLKILNDVSVENKRSVVTGWAKMFLSHCIQAEPIFVIEKCTGECGASPLVCDDCGAETDKLFIHPDEEPHCVCCGGNRDMVNDKCLTCLEDCNMEETHETPSSEGSV